MGFAVARMDSEVANCPCCSLVVAAIEVAFQEDAPPSRSSDE